MKTADITINSKAGVRVRYVNGPMTRLVNREGVLTGHRRDGMLTVAFEAGHDRCSEHLEVWPGSLERRLHRGISRDSATGEYCVTSEYVSGFTVEARFATAEEADAYLLRNKQWQESRT